ncbi:MAG: hypothetical protein OXC19_21375 [Bryobacterales bacterium]|nr:hypothetical protein [Bryobacterales bacterium]
MAAWRRRWAALLFVDNLWTTCGRSVHYLTFVQYSVFHWGVAAVADWASGGWALEVEVENREGKV